MRRRSEWARALQHDTQPAGCLRRFLELKQGLELLPDEIGLQTPRLPEGESLDVQPVLVTPRERLEYDQVSAEHVRSDLPSPMAKAEDRPTARSSKGMAPSETSTGTPLLDSIRRTR